MIQSYGQFRYLIFQSKMESKDHLFSRQKNLNLKSPILKKMILLSSTITMQVFTLLGMQFKVKQKIFNLNKCKDYFLMQVLWMFLIAMVCYQISLLADLCYPLCSNISNMSPILVFGIFSTGILRMTSNMQTIKWDSLTAIVPKPCPRFHSQPC